MKYLNRQTLQLGLLLCFIMWGWNTFLLYPLKLLVVLFHEASHGLGALFTGGKLLYIEITPNEGGLARIVGGWRWVSVSAGYLGSMLWGAVIYKAAHLPRFQGKVSALLGLILLALTLFYVRTITGVLLGLSFGGVLLASSKYFSSNLNGWFLKIIGLVSMLYAIFDIKDDLISRTVPGSDAWAMSQIVPLPPVLWGLIWIVMAIVCVFLVVRSSLEETPQT